MPRSARLNVVGVEPKGSKCNLKNLECSPCFIRVTSVKRPVFHRDIVMPSFRCCPESIVTQLEHSSGEKSASITTRSFVASLVNFSFRKH